MSQVKPVIIFGMHAVLALLKTAPQRFIEIQLLKSRNDQRLKKIIQQAEKNNITLIYKDRDALDQCCQGNHQGVVARVQEGESYTEKWLVESLDVAKSPLLLVLDGVTDPHNLGACLRSADAAGVAAVVIPKDNSAGMNETVQKVACGAAEAVPLVVVTNLARCLKKLKERGFWVSGAAGEATTSLYQADLSGPRVIVMGAEGSGMRRLTKELCDELVYIPMNGTVSSLNVSVATGVFLFESVRQRHI